MMKTQNNPSNKKTNSENSPKKKSTEEDNALKSQGIKVQLEGLKKKIDEKFKNPDNTKGDDETSTTNTQTSIYFDKNAALGIEKEPKNHTGGINMNNNENKSTTNVERDDGLEAATDTNKAPVSLASKENPDDKVDATGKAEANQIKNDDENVIMAEALALMFEENHDDDDDVITVLAEANQVKNENVIMAEALALMFEENHDDDDDVITVLAETNQVKNDDVISAEAIPLTFEENHDDDDEVITVLAETNQVKNDDVISAEAIPLTFEENHDDDDEVITVLAETNQVKNDDSNTTPKTQVNNNSNQINDTQMADTTEDKTLAEKETDNTPKEKTHEEKKKELQDKTELKSEENKLIDKETDQVKAIEAQKEARRKAIENMFKATGGNIPKIFDEVNKTLKDLMAVDKKLALTDITFSGDTALSAYRTPNFAASYHLDSTKDFYGMGIAEQDLLFERIGLFKGVVVDYSKENAIEQGYRNVVKFMNRPTSADNSTERPVENRSKPVRVFPKKPRHSGFYETTYAFDEYQKKSQESGILNLGFGLSASYNSGFTSAGLKAGYGYSKESLSEANTHIKEISIISSFYLPKIELSFDTLQPCASDDLIEYLEKALENEQDTIACFDRVNTILMSFGQFVPTSMVIGARLYSSDTKKIQQGEVIENVLTKHEAKFQMAFSGRVVEAGVEASLKTENSSKSSEKSTSEAQNIQFRAIGGEGAVITDMGKWVTSTANAMFWGLVRFDNLVPVIDLLPYDQQQRITNLFDRVVEECTIEELLSKGAQFLFHKGYFERFGRYAQPKFCVIKNSLGNKQVLSVKINGELENNQEVTMSVYDGIGGDIQEWYYANSGKIYLKQNYDTNNKFVLSIDTSKQPPKLVITQDDYFDNQFWDARGGMIQCLNNNNYITYDGNQIKLETQKESAKNNTWLLVDEKEMNTPSRRRIEAVVQKNTLMLSEGISDTLDNNYYLPLDGTLKSHSGYAQLKFSTDKIVILWGKMQKEIWSHPITNAGASKLAITNGTFAVLDEKDNILERIAADIADIRLMDSGNLEGVDKGDNINYESNSIVYAYIQSDSSKSTLSIIAQLNAGYKAINSQPYTGGDHQLWYINRKNNIVSKFTERNKKFALTEIITESSNHFQIAISGSYAGGFAPQKNLHVELGLLNTDNAKSQQWTGLAPNSRGNIENRVSKNKLEKGHGLGPLCDPNEQWVLVFDENAKQEANMPIISYSKSPADDNFLKYNLYKYWHSPALTDIYIKGQDIRAVRMNGEHWDDEKEAYHLKLQFRTSNGLILESSNVETGRYFSNGFIVPGLGGACYFSDETTILSLKLLKQSNETVNYGGPFQFETDKHKYGFVMTDLLHVNPYYYNDNTQLNSICSDWVEIPHDHKAIGVSFVKVSDSMVSPCLISIKK